MASWKFDKITNPNDGSGNVNFLIYGMDENGVFVPDRKTVVSLPFAEVEAALTLPGKQKAVRNLIALRLKADEWSADALNTRGSDNKMMASVTEKLEKIFTPGELVSVKDVPAFYAPPAPPVQPPATPFDVLMTDGMSKLTEAQMKFSQASAAKAAKPLAAGVSVARTVTAPVEAVVLPDGESDVPAESKVKSFINKLLYG